MGKPTIESREPDMGRRIHLAATVLLGLAGAQGGTFIRGDANPTGRWTSPMP